jgi:predicted transposase/invertase (TIGR01784 family)
MTNIGQPPVVKATVLNPLNIQEFPVDKQVRLDVLVEDELGAMYDVEVQTYPDKELFERMLLYWAVTYVSQIHRGDSYGLLRPVRSIVITEFPVFPELKRLHAVFEARARENPDVLFSNHFQMHILRLGDLLKGNISGLDDLCLPLQRWLQFFGFGSTWEKRKMSTMLQDVPEVQAAYEAYQRFSADPIMREKIRAREQFEIDQRLNRAYAEAEGEAKGRAEEKIEARREMILEFLLGRFGKVPKNIERAVNQMNDPIALKSLAARTGSCQTLAEFAAEL